MDTKTRYTMVIGRAEPLTFPELSLHNIPAKTDTGAYSSAIHCSFSEVVERDGRRILRYGLLEDHPCSPESHILETTEFNQVMVENSFGHRESRYEVKLKVKLGPKVFKTTFTLANRGKKIYPILLGRRFMRSRFLVDVSRTNIDRVMLKAKYGLEFPVDEESVYGEERA